MLPVLQPLLEPAAEGVRFLGEAQVAHGPHGQGGVADPGVAVVPVPLAALLLGQAHGRGGDGRAGGRVRHELEGDGGAVDDLLPAAPVAAASDPVVPETAHGGEFLRQLVRVQRPWSLARGVAHRQHDGRTLTGRQRHPGSYVTPVGLQRNRADGLQVCGDARTLEARGAAVQGEVVVRAAVVEARPALQGEAHGAPYRPHHPHHPVPVGDRGRMVDGHEVDHLPHALAREEAGDQDSGIGQVELAGDDAGLASRPASFDTRRVRGDGEVSAAVVVEQSGEDAGRVEAGRAEPVQHAFGGDECTRLQVPDQAVLGNRRIGKHRPSTSCRALSFGQSHSRALRQ